MRKWLLVLLALGALALAALTALPRIISDCVHESPLPGFRMAAVFLLVWAGAGFYVTIRGDPAQRTILFAGMALILFAYGGALSLILPMVLGPSCLPMT